MRKLYVFNMITLDGFFEGPNHDITWHNAENDEFNEFAIQQAGEVGTIVFGRVTYEMMASFWPSPYALEVDPIVAGLMNSTPKIVASRTLQTADWNNTRLIKDHVAEEIAKLKEQPGKDIAIFGSANLASTLMPLIDEYRLIINPLLLGQGVPMFKPMNEKLNLKLLDAKIFKSGNVLLYYQPVT